jgi:hypothetical protein
MAIEKIIFRKDDDNRWVMETYSGSGDLEKFRIWADSYLITIHPENGFAIDRTNYRFNPVEQQLSAFTFPESTADSANAFGYFKVEGLKEPAKDRAGSRYVLRAIGTADIADIGVGGEEKVGQVGPIHYQVIVNDNDAEAKTVLVHMDAHHPGTLIVVTNGHELQIRSNWCK